MSEGCLCKKEIRFLVGLENVGREQYRRKGKLWYSNAWARTPGQKKKKCLNKVGTIMTKTFVILSFDIGNLRTV